MPQRRGQSMRGSLTVLDRVVKFRSGRCHSELRCRPTPYGSRGRSVQQVGFLVDDPGVHRVEAERSSDLGSDL